jgi:hypothetical protein
MPLEFAPAPIPIILDCDIAGNILELPATAPAPEPIITELTMLLNAEL